jgi:hypothetical protein
VNTARTVSAEVNLMLAAPGQLSVPVTATLSYTTSDPYAVTLAIRVAGLDEPVEWIFARELLAAGLKRSAGIGDVEVSPAGEGTVCIRLSSPFGDASFETSAVGIASFVMRAYAMVPSGSETDHLNIDAELADLPAQSPPGDDQR